MSGRMTSKRKKPGQKPALEHLAKAALATQSIKLDENCEKGNSKVTFVTENTLPQGDIELLRPSRVDSIVGMEISETTRERLIE